MGLVTTDLVDDARLPGPQRRQFGEFLALAVLPLADVEVGEQLDRLTARNASLPEASAWV